MSRTFFSPPYQDHRGDLQVGLQGRDHRLANEMQSIHPSIPVLRWRTHALQSRGQALVEMALVLPVLALLLVMAIDFGRVFFGSIAIHNAARIGADWAAAHADAWDGAPGPQDKEDQESYQTLIVNDLQQLNCIVPSPDPVADPIFIDIDGDGSAHGDGDHGQVTLVCSFPLITPLASSVLGGPVALSAQADFAVNRRIMSNPPPPPPPPPAACSKPTVNFVGTTATGVTPPTGTSPLVVTFTDTSTDSASCPITAWSWDFGNGETSTLESPLPVTYAHLGPAASKKFDVKLTVTYSGGPVAEEKKNYVTVNKP